MRWVYAVLRAVLLTILVVACAALFYVLVIMGGTSYDVTDLASEAAYGPAAAIAAGYAFTGRG